MADQSYSDYVQMFANAQVPMKKHNKGLQLMAIKYKLLNKTLGPFVDLWLKMKQGVQLAGDVMEAVIEPFEKTTEAVDTLNETVAVTTGYFKQFLMSIVLMIGIIMAFVGVIFLMAGSFANMDSVMPGTTDMIDGLKNALASVIEAGKGVVGVIMSLDFSPILGPLGMLIGGVVQLMAFVLQVYAVIAVGYMEIFTMMGEGGQLQAIIDAVGGVFESVVWGFGFIIAQLEAVGVTGGSTLAAIQSFVNTFVAFLFDSGIIDFLVEIFMLGAEIGVAIIKVSAVIIGLLIRYLVVFWNNTSGYWKALAGAIGIIIVLVVGAFRVLIAMWRGIIAFFSGDFEGALKHFESVEGIVKGVFGKVTSLFKGMIDNFMDFLQPFIDKIERVAEIAGDITGGVSSGAGKAWDAIGFADGGISTGPNSGYMTQLHGTEAVVPLPNGRSIPVEISGAMGGGGGSENITVNINVSGGGNADEIARKVSQEVARTFRNRSRSSGFGRGI